VNAPARILTSLRNAPSAPLPREELDRLRAQAWTERGLICIAPEEINNDFVRQGIVNEATKRWGRRMKRGN
jgi:hypothetical protein